MLELGEADGWKEIGKKNGVTIYNKSMEHNIKAVMGRGTMPYSVQQVILANLSDCRIYKR